MKKIIFAYVVLSGLLSMAFAQDLSLRPDPAGKVPDSLRMSAMLYNLGKFTEANEFPEAIRAKIESLSLLHDSLDRVNVELVLNPDTLLIDQQWLSSLNQYVDGTWRNRASLWVSPKDLIPLTAHLPAGYSMHAVFVADASQDNQGPGLMGSSTYNTATSDGSGKRVAIIDVGFEGLTASQNVGAAPSLSFDWTFAGGFQSNGNHGTNCLETAFDHAPGAAYEAYKVDNPTHLGRAVDSCIAHGVDVISHSLSWYNRGWDDNSGPACIAANLAASNGILFFTSAGNRARQHWQGNFVDGDNDDWHNFSGGDERADITINSGGRIWVSLQWDNPNVNISDDYDLYLLDDNGQILISSLSSTGFEELSWTNNSSTTDTVHISVRHFSGGTPEFELFCRGRGLGNMQHSIAASSHTSPSNSTNHNVIAVGAVHRQQYHTATGGTGIIMNYSSQGPSNSGNRGLDLVGPTSTTTSFGTFGGTSCSTPNVAGMAAAFWSAHDNYSARGVRQVLFRKARLYKDWGASGDDVVYGHGGARLYEYYPHTIYIYRHSNNVAGNNTLPYYNIEQADAHTPSGSTYRGVFLGQTYPQPPAGTILDRPRFYISLVRDAIVE